MKAEDISLTSPEELIRFGEHYGRKHKKVLLYGELGSGKTTFVRGFAKALGIDPDTITTPSDTLINVYEGKLLHVDMRRIDTIEKADQIDLRDKLETYEHIAIERPKWEERYQDDTRVSLTFKDDELSGRSIHLQ